LLEAIPTNAEFEARTLPSADYFDPATDVVANVTLVGTVTAVTGLTASNLDATVSSRATPAQVNSALSDIGLTLARVKRLVSMASGKIVENPSESGVFEFYDEDGTTLLYTLTAAGDERTPDLSP
jgi:hypothetical protein